MEENKCCERTKHRSEKEKKDLITRLNRIEGQVRGIKNMVEEERYGVEILNQVSAVQSALNCVNKKLVASQIPSGVGEDIRDGQEEAVDELCEVIQKLMK